MKAEDLLTDSVNQGDFGGISVRKGTVGAFLINARMWCDHGASVQSRAEAERDIVDAIPALRALGIFEVMDIRDAALRELIEAH
jgi:hypothetical protein